MILMREHLTTDYTDGTDYFGDQMLIRGGSRTCASSATTTTLRRTRTATHRSSPSDRLDMLPAVSGGRTRV
jgi:hypothetical protein